MDGSRGAALRLALLGGFHVRVDGRDIPAEGWTRRKAAALVKLLALAPGHRLHREQAMELLWPELDPEQAANSLHQALHAARRTLAGDGADGGRYLILRDQVVQFEPRLAIWVDAVAFEAAAAEAHRRRNPDAYRSALALYAGDLLPDDRYKPWAGDRREALRAEYLALLLGLAGCREAAGASADAIAAVRRVVAVDPLNEPAHRALMRLHARSGQRQHAIRQFHTLRDALASELGVEPEPESQRLYEQVRAGEIAAEAPTGGVGGQRPRHNLPAPVSSFIGREREKAEVRRLLAGTRLLTLTGPGGCGKTRLALEVAGEIVDAYDDGVWSIEFAPLTDPALLPQAVAAALGVRESPSQPLRDTLSAWLKPRRTLLILDNCEHLIDACARFAESLLRAAPGLSILATSREPLRIAGEATWLVPSLSLPDPGGPADLDRLLESEAVQLFLDRAGRAVPGFGLTPENGASVAELCYRLDGIPLAIELAAARVRALGVGQIVARLGDRFRLLTGGSRAALSRQQTLRAALDWSYDLLSEPERALFARLAVFAGSFDLPAVEAVVGGGVPGMDRTGEGPPPPLVLDLLLQLVDRSLVAVGNDGDVARYHLLETMRDYARERLVERGELDALRRAHADHYAALAKRADRQLRGVEQAAWVERLEREHDNLRAALEWYRTEAEVGRPEPGLELAGTLHWFWHLGGHFSEGTAWLERLLAHRAGMRTEGLATALTGSGILASTTGGFARAQRLLDDAIAIWRELDRPAGLALALTWSGWCALFLGGPSEARARHGEGLALFTRLGDRWGIALASLGLGFDAAESDEHALARELFERSLALFRDLRDDWGVATTLQQVANLTYRLGDFATARELVADVLALEQRMGDRWLEVQSRLLLGEIARAEEEYETAASAVAASLELAQAIGHRTALAWALRDAGFVALARHDSLGARARFRKSMAHFRVDAHRLGLVCCLIGMAGVAAAEGRPDAAARHLGTAQAALERLGLALAPADRGEAERIAAAARTAIGDAAFTTAREAGRNVPLEEALAAAADSAYVGQHGYI